MNMHFVCISSFHLQAMLIYDPALRISARDALTHLYFNDLDKENQGPINN